MRSLLVLMLCLTGCAMTLDSVWRAPELRARKIKTFAVLGQTPRPSGRLAFEKALSGGLQARGLQAVPSYSLMSFDINPDRQAFIARLKSRHIDAVLVSRIIDHAVHVDTYATGGPAGPYYRGWYGYSSMYGTHTTVSVEYTVETVLFDLEGEQPLWAALSTTTHKSPEEFGTDIADPIADDLLAAGVISHAASPP